MKKLLYGLLGLMLVYFILAFAGPSKIDVEKNIVINRPASVVAPLMADMKFFNENWNPWTDLDSAMKVNYTGEAGKVGHASSWEGNSKVGSGTMEITAVTADSVTQKLFFGGHDGGNAYIITKSMGDSCSVSWQMKSEIGFMARPFMLFMGMEKEIGEMYEKGLPKLKKTIEAMPVEPSFAITEQKWEERTYLGKREVVSTENNMEKLSAFFMTNYPLLFMALEKNKVAGQAPSAIYFSWEEKQTDVAAVSMVPAGTKIKGLETWTIPASNVLSVAYYGADGGSIHAHNAIGKYLQKNKLESSYIIEESVTNRAMEKDTAKWLTNIYYVLK